MHSKKNEFGNERSHHGGETITEFKKMQIVLKMRFDFIKNVSVRHQNHLGGCRKAKHLCS